jgi:quinoprotein glucose dehydrogenase
LWTGDNNSDGGDPARWVYLVEGGDSGWRIGWQFITSPNARGPWMAERMCYPDSQVAYALPPIANIGNGPSGLAYYPGVGLPARYNEHFFLCDFRGSTGSGVHSFAVRPKGAGFELVDRTDFIWEVLVTDGDFGFDGSFYISDWVNGWNKPGKGRLYRVYDPATADDPVIVEMKKLFAEGFRHRPALELTGLLTHPDMRVRQEAQFALAERGETSIKTFSLIARRNENLFARLHAIWGLGQIASSRKSSDAVEALIPLLQESDAEVRAQAARVLGEARARQAFSGLTKLLSDPAPRPRFFAAIALSKIGRSQAVAPVVDMLRMNDNRDVHLRHAGVIGLAGCAKPALLAKMAGDSSAGVRMAALLALRRLQRPEIAAFLADKDPAIALETARAINDLPIVDALPALAKLADPETIRDAIERQRKHPAATAKTSAAGETVDHVSALSRRILNANFRLGLGENAARLVAMATNTQVPEPVRTEALAALASWHQPSGRDRVTGLWRPIERRDPKIAGRALEPRLSELLASPSPALKIAATKAAAQLGLQSAGASALAILRDAKQPANVRVEALRSLALTKDAKLPEAVKIGLSDADEALRKEATSLQAQLQPGDAVTQLRSVLESGSLGEKQNAFATLGALTNSPAADELLLLWMERLLAGEVAKELHVDLLDAASRRAVPRFQERIRQFENSRPADDDLRAWRECLTGGNAVEGKKIFVERAEVYCVRCHKVAGEGGEVGPELTGIGSRKDRQYLLESIVFPNKHLAEGYESASVELKNGAGYRGTIKRETESELELNSPEDGLVKINKADVKSRGKDLSAMPEELRQVLSKHDLRDLVEFLATLK